MITIKKVTTKKEQKDFLGFPIKLYKGSPYFVPPLYIDEKKIFNKDYVYYDTCEAIYFNAYKDGKHVGRISGILQKASNEKNNEKRVRFTRFDSIDDQEVANALFDAVEKWALEKGMDTVCGPLGFSDLEREGLLVEGFDELATFEEQYNAPYYEKLIKNCGYEKEVDWLESKIYAPDEESAKELEKMSDLICNRYGLRFGEAKNMSEFIKKYCDDFFRLIDQGYEHLYGTVPFTDGMKKMTIENFKLVTDIDHIAIILDENDHAVAMGFCIPSIAHAMQISGGHLSPKALIKLLKSMKKPEIIDFALIAVEPEYLNRGISAIFANSIAKMLNNGYTKYAETNLNLEDNHAIRNLWKRFNSVEHKRRRAFFKKIK